LALPGFITRINDTHALIRNIDTSPPPENGQSGQGGLRERDGGLDAVKPQMSEQLGGPPIASETIERPFRLKVVVKEHNEVKPPIRLNFTETIDDPKKYIDATLADLESYVTAFNCGIRHWVGKLALLEEKIEGLRRCGVKVEIRELHESFTIFATFTLPEEEEQEV